MRLRTRFALLCAIAAMAIPALASRGDQLPEFRECVHICKEKSCYPSSPEPIVIPNYLRFLAWDCPSECDYRCQHTTTALLKSQQLPVEQFHGKWPFYRIFGMQELFSVIFSLANLLAHYDGYQKLKLKLPKGHPLFPVYKWYAYTGIWCWAWSAIFHTRDLLWTERMDYFGAGANVMYGLFLAPIRIFHGYYAQNNKRADAPRSNSKVFKPWVFPWGVTSLCLYLAHVYYLTFVRWSYTYNMAANVVVGSIQNLLWSYFSLSQYGKRGGSTEASWPGLIVMWIVAAMGLELLDFPPLGGLIDAHSLWHAATVGPTMWWYSFLLADTMEGTPEEAVELKHRD